jgi:phasin family protein
MFDPKDFMFSPEKLAEFMTGATKGFDAKAFGFDPKAFGFGGNDLMAAQQKNMDAMTAANKAAAAAYQDLFTKQVKVFQDTMAEAQKTAAGFDASKMDAETAKVRTELANKAFEKAMANMTAMAEAARAANTEAYEIVAKRVADSMKELQDAAKKFSA